MKKLLLASACASIMGLLPFTSYADEYGLRADSHAPIGVMGDHMHKAGEWMISARTMRMEMKDSRSGTTHLSPETIATTVPNRFFGIAGQPPTLRVVPTKMTTDMVMLGGMFAPTDYMTLMLMGNYIDRDMDHITFQGGAGTTRLGTFTTKARGWGDTKLGTLIRLYEDSIHHVHFNAGLSLPTGSIKKEDDVLTPMNMRPTLRLPYAMQLGTGTYDLLPGVTYSGKQGHYGWGAQYAGTIHLGKNSQNYTWGDKHQMSIWGSYLITPAVSVSARITGETEQKISGIDSQIVAPVQSADPENYGGRRVSAALGLNTVVPNGILKGHRFSAEITLPVYQDLNGPQLERDHSIMIGWSKAF
ncbi:MAG: transporter [Alphaproteobacteria bacterium]|nr:transporter [Alphaproteobacteria bacterium]